MGSGLEDRFQTLHEIVRAAKSRLPAGEWDYLMGGTETETTLRRNRLALDSIAFRPRVLRNVSRLDASSTFLGRPVRIPVMFAPIGSVESFTPGGGATAAQASAEFGVPQMLSSACNPGLEATAKAADNFRIFQLYVRGDDAFVDDHVKRAKDHGYAVFCMTVDTAMYSRRERDLARRFVKPWRVRATGQDFQSALSWDQVKRFKDTHTVPLILKGIATAEDAALACEHGVDVVYVSNHGRRRRAGLRARDGAARGRDPHRARPARRHPLEGAGRVVRPPRRAGGGGAACDERISPAGGAGLLSGYQARICGRKSSIRSLTTSTGSMP